MLGEPSRRFTVLDTMALVGAVGIGLALARAYQSSMESAAVSSTENCRLNEATRLARDYDPAMPGPA